ncbi:hypothetical protein F511_15486 [Dorcoceras hygrometricum]|uniref:Uncharacterized protein n=1 Tax=Dorcoceras hygrometricum TaxID=472368 RepID=A0A2Z7CSB5_9LAMI|nr:hypothetical protein F511_15486 [Dorcoceras hygrometricum]
MQYLNRAMHEKGYQESSVGKIIAQRLGFADLINHHHLVIFRHDDSADRSQCSTGIQLSKDQAQYFENQGFEIQLDYMNPNDKESDSLQDKPERSSANSLDTETNHYERAIVAHSGPGRQVQPNISYPESRLVASIRFWDLDWATQLLPRIAPRDNGKKIMEVASRLYPVVEHCRQLEIENVYHEHLANFKLDALSVNYDYFYIQRLHKELKVNSHGAKKSRAMAGLPIADEEVSFFESASNQPLLLEFSILDNQEQAAAQTGSQQLDQPSNETTAMISQENEPPAQKDGHQAVENEHQAHNEQAVNLPGSDRSLEKHSAAIVLSEDNPETVTASEKNNYDHQGPVPSNLQLAVPTPTDRSTLQFMETTTQTLTTLSPRVSSLDLCAHINDVKNLTRHHTTLLCEQLKNAVDRLDIKIDVLERTLSKIMNDSHQHFTKMETTIVRNYADSHQQLVDELALVKSQLAAMVESIKEFGAEKRAKEEKIDRGRD